MPAIVFVTRAPSEWAIVIFSLAFFGQQSWSTLVMIVPTDFFETRVVASVAGLVGFGGARGGLLMNLVAGRLLDAGFTYAAVFNIVGSLQSSRSSSSWLRFRGSARSINADEARRISSCQ